MQSNSDHQDAVLRQPLVLGNHEALVNDDIDLLAEHISLAVPLREIAAIGPSDDFRQRSSYRIAGDIGLTAATITPTRMVVEACNECSIVLLRKGHATYELEGSPYLCQAGSVGMFLPGMDYQVESSLASGLVYNLSHQLLARYLCEATQGGIDLDQALHHLQQPHPIDLKNPALQSVLFGLQVLIRTIDSLGQEELPSSQPMLHLQEGIYALSTALLLPDYAPQALASWQLLPGLAS
jgi:hypothetical protein